MTVLITGASGGLGRVMATECAHRGYDLFLTDWNKQGLIDITNGIKRQYPVEVRHKACDLTDIASIGELFDYLDSVNVRVNMLLNIAGVDFEGGFMDQPCEKLVNIIRLNIEATIRVTHAALLRRHPDDKFNIIIVSSLASMYPIPLKATYAASKRFLLDFSIALREELKHKNASVLALCPGGLPTTTEALLGIAGQSFWGSLTTNNLCTVARNAISRVLAGKPIYIPGKINVLLSVLGQCLPRTCIARILYRRWHIAQNKWPELRTKLHLR